MGDTDTGEKIHVEIKINGKEIRLRPTFPNVPSHIKDPAVDRSIYPIVTKWHDNASKRGVGFPSPLFPIHRMRCVSTEYMWR